VTNPVLAVIGDHDQVASAAAIRPLAVAAPRADTWETHVGAGHLGLVVGSKAKTQGWPAVIDWVHWADGLQPEPRIARRIREVEAEERASAEATPREPRQPSIVKAGSRLALSLAATVAQSAVGAATGAAELGQEALE